MATQTGSIDLKGITSAYSDQQQYFWVESDSSATWGGGAHITNVAESAFKTAAGTWGTNPTAGGYNLLMNTDTANETGSLQLRNGSLPIMSLDNDSLDFNTIDITSGTYTTVASFGVDGSTIGKADGTQSYLHQDYHSIQMIDKEGNVYLLASDLRDMNGLVHIEQTFYGDGQRTRFGYQYTPTSPLEVTVTVDGEQVDYTWVDLKVKLSSAPPQGSVVKLIYDTESSAAKGYTFGIRAEEYIAPFSIAMGLDVSPLGTLSVASGEGTIATGLYQHVIGSYNIPDTGMYPLGMWLGFSQPIGKYAFIIGNGTEDTARSNALTVDWLGNVEAAGHITSAITACGNNSTELSLTTSEQRIPMTTYRSVVGSQLSVSNNGVLCGKNGFVEVSAVAYFTSGFTANDLVHLIVKRNDALIYDEHHRMSSTYENCSVAPIVYEVSAGDILYLSSYNQTATRGKISRSIYSSLTVKYL